MPVGLEDWSFEMRDDSVPVVEAIASERERMRERLKKRWEE